MYVLSSSLKLILYAQYLPGRLRAEVYRLQKAIRPLNSTENLPKVVRHFSNYVKPYKIAFKFSSRVVLEMLWTFFA